QHGEGCLDGQVGDSRQDAQDESGEHEAGAAHSPLHLAALPHQRRHVEAEVVDVDVVQRRQQEALPLTAQEGGVDAEANLRHVELRGEEYKHVEDDDGEGDGGDSPGFNEKEDDKDNVAAQ
ncbi:hypothetical protein chiPu_0031533, partial [Chiloscyllium punctatum]|nr:hypothetical protein [Chiloscyllium punctatum]